MKNYKSDKVRNVSQNKNISIGDFFVFIAENFGLIIKIPLLAVITMIIYSAYFIKPMYTSHARIMSSSSKPSSGQISGLASKFGINLSSNGKDQIVYTELIKSRTLTRNMLKRRFNTDKFGPNITLIEILANGELKGKAYNHIQESIAINLFLEKLIVYENKKTGIIDIKFTSFEAKFVKDILTALIEELDFFQKNRNKLKTGKTRKFIEERINDTYKELEFSEENLKDFSDRNRRIENSPLLQLDRQRLSREVSVLTGVYTTLKQELEMVKIEEVRDSEYIVTLDRPEIPINRSSPNRTNLVIITTIVSLLFTFIFVLIKNIFTRNKSNIEIVKIIESKNILLNDITKILIKLRSNFIQKR